MPWSLGSARAKATVCTIALNVYGTGGGAEFSAIVHCLGPDCPGPCMRAVLRLCNARAVVHCSRRAALVQRLRGCAMLVPRMRAVLVPCSVIARVAL
eukprot:6711724-Alexandrium_andersonii.AAC.1